MSPILVRPVREQLEHDRVVRLLQAKYRRKHEVAINIGPEQLTSVQVGESQLYPDLVLLAPDKGRKLQGTIEVETGESINSLEAMAQWVPFSRLKAPFILYVPPMGLDAARRLCAAHGADPAEIWTYHISFDQVRFTLAHRSPNAPSGLSSAVTERPAKTAAPAKATAPAKTAAPAKAVPAKPSVPYGKPASKGPPVATPATKAKPDARAKPAVKAKPAPAPKTRPAAKSKPASQPVAKKAAATKARPAATAKPASKPVAKKAVAKKAAKARPAKKR